MESGKSKTQSAGSDSLLMLEMFLSCPQAQVSGPSKGNPKSPVACCSGPLSQSTANGCQHSRPNRAAGGCPGGLQRLSVLPLPLTSVSAGPLALGVAGGATRPEGGVSCRLARLGLFPGPLDPVPAFHLPRSSTSLEGELLNNHPGKVPGDWPGASGLAEGAFPNREVGAGFWPRRLDCAH